MTARLVPADAVRPHLAPAHFAFETTAELVGASSVGEAAMRLQPRARAAFEVAVATRAPGFHVFASGSPHLLKLDAVLAQLRGAAHALPRASDWAYVFNEAQPERPLPLRLPAGEGPRYATAVTEAVGRVRRELPRVLEGGRLRRRQAALVQKTETSERTLLSGLEHQLRHRHFDVRRTRGQLEAVPFLRGRAVTRPLGKLPAAQRRVIEAALPEAAELVEEANRKLGELRGQLERELLALRNDAALEVASRALAPLERDFAHPDTQAHLARLRTALTTQHALFLEEEAQEERLRRFWVHVLVTHDEAGAPVVKEGNPTATALFGTTSREVEQGVLTTDFAHLRPGALHRANGGFLVLPGRALLAQPEVWSALKRSLRTREIHPEEGDLALGASAAQPLNPEPIPLECSVVLTGEVELFEALYEQDPDFRELFGVRADFSESAALDAAALADAAQVVAALTRQEQLLPFDPGGVARALEFSLWLADDQRRLSLEWDRLRLLLVEASHEAKRDASPRVRAEHVRRAEEAARWRSGLQRERLEDQIRRGLLRLSVSGTAPAQVNALALSQLGDSVVGRAARVSARVGPGTRGLVDIEHLAELSGPVYAKAVMQLQAYLLGRFGAQRPLSLDATLTFEQSYFAVEGDSASVAELVALVSALTGAPVRQGLAVSCSLGQDGGAQVVGGITAKVEGFFHACQVLGLDGEQGVILAAGNVQHLVLSDEVVEAIARGRFHLHAIEHSDEAVELLLGLAPAEVDTRVAARLEAFRAFFPPRAR